MPCSMRWATALCGCARAIIPITQLGSNLSYDSAADRTVLVQPDAVPGGHHPLFLHHLLPAGDAAGGIQRLPPGHWRPSTDSGLLDEDELDGARKVLRAAALTYVAALLMSLVQLLRFVLIFLARAAAETGEEAVNEPFCP